MMAAQSGNNDAASSGQAISSQLRGRDLPSKRLLGKGLASIVYETEWNGERFARKDFIGVPSAAFQKEAAILVGLEDHENVVKTHARTVDKMSCSLVLEYMEEDLLDLLQKRKESHRGASGTASGSRCEGNRSYPFELSEALAILSQIARGMEFLHEQNVPHGDLKTKNILVSHINDGDKNVLSVKVSDFGLARTKSRSMSFVSRQARKLDAVQWKAPEVLERLLSEDNGVTSSESDSNSDTERTGSLSVSDRLGADVYSFAVTCSQILTGEGPYPNGNWKELGSKIVSGELRPNLPAACPELLKSLLESCWAKSLAERPTFSFIRDRLDWLVDFETRTHGPGQVLSQVARGAQQKGNALSGIGLPLPPWQSEQDTGLRHQIVDNILQLFKDRKPHVTPEWQQKLPDFVKRLEEALYKNAASKDEYADLKTLEQRLQSAARRMVPKQSSHSEQGHFSLKEVREKNKFLDNPPPLVEKRKFIMEPRRRPGFTKLTIELRPRGFKKKLWFGTFEPEEVERAKDAINYYTGSNLPYHYSDSPLIFAEIPLKGIQFKDLQSSCEQFIEVGNQRHRASAFFAREVKAAIHSVIGRRKEFGSPERKRLLGPGTRETSPSSSLGNISSITEELELLTSSPSSIISPFGENWLYTKDSEKDWMSDGRITDSELEAKSAISFLNAFLPESNLRTDVNTISIPLVMNPRTVAEKDRLLRDLPSKRLLGKGLASIVYETEWNGERFARKDFIGVPSAAFQKEAAILVGLEDHENVVKTHARTVDKMSCSLVLEYMEEDLLDLLQKRKESHRGASGTASGSRCEGNRSYPFELSEALAILSQIARGMEFLHEQNVPHGDLKTKNILVSHINDGDKNVLSVKVSDFGLARTKSRSMSFVSRQARKLDAVQWKAPEVLERLLSEDNGVTSSESDSNSDTERTGSLSVSDRLGADVYSFAVTCSQILTGEGPYPNGNWKELGSKIVSGELRPNLPAACPELLKSLLESCWAKSLAERPTFSFIRDRLDWLVDFEARRNPSLNLWTYTYREVYD